MGMTDALDGERKKKPHGAMIPDFLPSPAHLLASLVNKYHFQIHPIPSSTFSKVVKKSVNSCC
jgi:hypothetical protein